MSSEPAPNKRAKRYACAILASAVTTFLGLAASPFSHAETCTWRDVSAWQMALIDETVERSPSYILEQTEAFLSACPQRPEIADANRIAGRASFELGNITAAAAYFENAEPIRDIETNFYVMSTLLALRREDDAWHKRDRVIAAWWATLQRSASAKVEQLPVPGGTIYRAILSDPGKGEIVRAVWIGVPDGAGWPATLSVARDSNRLDFQKVRLGAGAEDLLYVDLYRCQGRRALARQETAKPVPEMNRAARTALTAYLANPDISAPQPHGPDITSCLWPDKLLPLP